MEKAALFALIIMRFHMPKSFIFILAAGKAWGCTKFRTESSLAPPATGIGWYKALEKLNQTFISHSYAFGLHTFRGFPDRAECQWVRERVHVLPFIFSPLLAWNLGERERVRGTVHLVQHSFMHAIIKITAVFVCVCVRTFAFTSDFQRERYCCTFLCRLYAVFGVFLTVTHHMSGIYRHILGLEGLHKISQESFSEGNRAQVSCNVSSSRWWAFALRGCIRTGSWVSGWRVRCVWVTGMGCQVFFSFPFAMFTLPLEDKFNPFSGGRSKR